MPCRPCCQPGRTSAGFPAPAQLLELEAILQHPPHAPSAGADLGCQRIVHDGAGRLRWRITERVEAFLTQHLGNPEVPAGELQAEWSALMAELRRVHTRRARCGRCRHHRAHRGLGRGAMGPAPARRAARGAQDDWLPDNWREVCA